MIERPLVFVDLETTGLSPERDRVTEIGLVCVEREEVFHWSTLVNPALKVSEGARRLNGITNDTLAKAPRFRDIAPEILQKLEGRLFIAHNARFDVSFLKAEFKRLGHEFQPQALCSVMLSRKLYPEFKLHDLDSLIERHGLTTSARHRALPDAQSIWQFWESIREAHSAHRIATAVAELLASPVFPAHLDPALIDRLPERPGVFVFHGMRGETLKVGKASNLKCDLQNYFRLDRLSGKALAISHRIVNITWQVTQGPLDSQLRHGALARTQMAAKRPAVDRDLYSWRIAPESVPSVQLVCLSQESAYTTASSFGIFASERKARNALNRIATQNRLCYSVLGIRESAENACVACSSEGMRTPCSSKTERLRRLTRTLTALRHIQLTAWPYAGPIGIREGRGLHIFDDWRYLGTATTDDEMCSILDEHVPAFDQDIYVWLSKRLPRISARRIVNLTRKEAAYVS